MIVLRSLYFVETESRLVRTALFSLRRRRTNKQEYDICRLIYIKFKLMTIIEDDEYCLQLNLLHFLSRN